MNAVIMKEEDSQEEQEEPVTLFMLLESLASRCQMEV